MDAGVEQLHLSWSLLKIRVHFGHTREEAPPYNKDPKGTILEKLPIWVSRVSRIGADKQP